jgi:hypothetical protein
MQIVFPPLDFTDAGILLAISAILLLITSQILPTFSTSLDSPITKRRLDNAAIIVGMMFLGTVIIRVVGIIQGA